MSLRRCLLLLLVVASAAGFPDVDHYNEEKEKVENFCARLQSLQQEYCASSLELYPSSTPLSTQSSGGRYGDDWYKEEFQGDGPVTCPSGWERFRSSCYVVGGAHLNWYSAQSECNKAGGYLAEIADSEENEFVGNLSKRVLVDKHPKDAWPTGAPGTQGVNCLSDSFKEWDSYVWLGATDAENEGQWRWATSKTLANFQHWYTGEPNSFMGTDEDCVELYSHRDTFPWNDESCWSKRHFVCEMTLQ